MGVSVEQKRDVVREPPTDGLGQLFVLKHLLAGAAFAKSVAGREPHVRAHEPLCAENELRDMSRCIRRGTENSGSGTDSTCLSIAFEVMACIGTASVIMACAYLTRFRLIKPS